MSLSLNRKRSRLALEEEEDEQRYRDEDATSGSTADLKRTRTQGELEEIAVIAPGDAWHVDVDSILSSPTLPPSSGGKPPQSNVSRHAKGSSIIVLCVQGNMHLHYDLLCAMLPELHALSPSLQAFVLCRDPSSHVPSITTPFSLPLIQGLGPGYNHFLRLGLLHPLGGGQFPLDALVVLDTRGRRRLVLPFGWGGGRHAGTPAGKGVQKTLMELLRSCVDTLVREG